MSITFPALTSDGKMSTSDVPKLRVLSATLWSIVNTNYVVLFPRAANIVCEIYQTNPQIMPIARLTDILMDLKIKVQFTTMTSKLVILILTILLLLLIIIVIIIVIVTFNLHGKINGRQLYS